jgi:hypothetical protein
MRRSQAITQSTGPPLCMKVFTASRISKNAKYMSFSF